MGRAVAALDLKPPENLTCKGSLVAPQVAASPGQTEAQPEAELKADRPPCRGRAGGRRVRPVPGVRRRAVSRAAAGSHSVIWNHLQVQGLTGFICATNACKPAGAEQGLSVQG